jgi:chromosome segregation ATPase
MEYKHSKLEGECLTLTFTLDPVENDLDKDIFIMSKENSGPRIGKAIENILSSLELNSVENIENFINIISSDSLSCVFSRSHPSVRLAATYLVQDVNVENDLSQLTLNAINVVALYGEATVENTFEGGDNIWEYVEILRERINSLHSKYNKLRREVNELKDAARNMGYFVGDDV